MGAHCATRSLHRSGVPRIDPAGEQRNSEHSTGRCVLKYGALLWPGCWDTLCPNPNPFNSGQNLATVAYIHSSQLLIADTSWFRAASGLFQQFCNVSFTWFSLYSRSRVTFHGSPSRLAHVSLAFCCIRSESGNDAAVKKTRRLLVKCGLALGQVIGNSRWNPVQTWSPLV